MMVEKDSIKTLSCKVRYSDLNEIQLGIFI